MTVFDTNRPPLSRNVNANIADKGCERIKIKPIKTGK